MYEDDFEDESGSNLVKDLRKQLKALQKERDEAAEQLKTLASQAKSRSIQEVLTSKGANPKLAKFALADGVEDEAGAEAWLAENGELFGFKAKSDEPAIDEDDLAAARLTQELTASGGVTTSTRLSQQEQFVNEANTKEEWTERINALKHGTPLD